MNYPVSQALVDIVSSPVVRTIPPPASRQASRIHFC